MDSAIDKSDVLSILQSIDTLYTACQSVLNTYSQSALMLSIATEAEMLLLKLKVMKERWEYHLPFKEACQVDFHDWSKKIKQMSQTIGGSVAGDADLSLNEYCPSKHFLLDLYECLDENASIPDNEKYYTELNVGKLIATQDRIRRQITRGWGKYKYVFSDLVAIELAQRIENVLQPLADRSVNIQLTCYEVLRDLSTQLYELFKMPKGTITPEQFERLAERVINESEYNGRKALDAARHEVDTLKNGTPKKDWPTRREETINTITDLVGDMKHGCRVFDFLGADFNLNNHLAGLGQFFISVRASIGDEEIYDLLYMLYQILYLIEDRDQQAAAEAKVKEMAEPDSKAAHTVYAKRLKCKPLKPALPKFFSEKLTGNADAIKSYYATLHHCGFFIGRTLVEEEKRDPDRRCYAGWKWTHLREAFVKLGFFRADSSKKGFAEHLAEVFPYLGATNIQRGFNSRGGYTDPNATHQIILDIMHEFDDVKTLMES